MLSILLFVISSTLDSFVVGLSYGIKKIKINFLNNLFVAIISGIGTLLSMLLGKFICHNISTKTGTTIGSLILILFGLYFIITSFKKNYHQKPINDEKIYSMEYYDDILKNPELADKDKSNTIEFKEALILGIALSLNNIGLGIGASIVGLNPYLTSLLSFAFSIIFIQLGYCIGESFLSKVLSKYAELFSGIIILGLGIYELFL